VCGIRVQLFISGVLFQVCHLLYIFVVTTHTTSIRSFSYHSPHKHHTRVAIIGVILATFMATKLGLEKPERVSVAVEGCYQNTGIATSVATSMFPKGQLATAVGVPLYYGMVEAFILACYCIVSWKRGWTKAPSDEKFCKMITHSYEVEQARMESPNAIEVVHNSNPKSDGDIEDLVFNQTIEGYQVDESSLYEQTNASLQEQRDMAKNATPENSGRTDDKRPQAEAGEFT